MITPEYACQMSVYNHWQNDSLITAADTLDDDARRSDRGAFFGSIHKTLNHILWADQIWMHRLAATPKPAAMSIPESVAQHDSWNEYKAARHAFDQMMMAWARRLGAEDFTGHLTWYSGAIEANVTNPRAVLVVHMFNHQTHHRGQVHAMLTAAGARPGDTDMAFMPAAYAALLRV